jgi:putative restriction endonuclease
MKFYVGVTDYDWYRFLSERENEDINFWQPGGSSNFKVINTGAPFLFKLKAPYNSIAGVGFFSSHSILPLDVAWNIFENRNGLGSFNQFKQKIIKYRGSKNEFSANPNIGCIILTDPIFFDEKDWIGVPESWSKSIVQGKSYDTTTSDGRYLWDKVDKLLEKYNLFERLDTKKGQLVFAEPDIEYSKRYLTKVRIGQGAFRVQLTDAYNRKCSVSGEKTLPVLEAAHIKPYSESGPNLISNGILLRSDMHKLFDAGYMTITKDYRVEVSRKIKEEFENGKEYYKFQGSELLILPSNLSNRPDPNYIEWHNKNIYNG